MQKDQATASERQKEGELYLTTMRAAGAAWQMGGPGAEDSLDDCPPHLCHWEWHYLKRLYHSEKFSLPGSRAVAFSPNSHLLATGTAGAADGLHAQERGGLVLWDADTGREAGQLGNITMSPLALAFSPDGQRLAATTAAPDRILIWDRKDGHVVRSIGPHAPRAGAVAFSSDGRRLASLDTTGAVTVWDADTGNEVLRKSGGKRLGDSPTIANTIAFSTSDRLAVCAEDNSVWIIDLASGREVLRLPRQEKTVQAVAFSRDGRWLATGADKVGLWDAATGQMIAILKTSGPVYALAFAPDSATLASAGDDQAVTVWDVARRTIVHTLRGHTAPIVGLAFQHDGQRLASVGLDDTVKVWDVEEDPGARYLRWPAGGLAGYRISPDGQRLLAGCTDKTVKVWELATRQLLFSYEGHDQAVTGVACSRDGRWCASGSMDRTIHVWDAATRQLRCICRGHTEGVADVDLDRNGSRVVSTGLDKTLRLWDATTGKELVCLPTETVAGCVAFSPDGTSFAFGALRNEGRRMIGVVKLHAAGADAAACRQLLSLQMSTGGVHDLEFSSDGTRLAAAGDENGEGVVRVWDRRSGTQLLRLREQEGSPTGVRFSGDGRRLFTVNFKGLLTVWDAETGQKLLSLLGVRLEQGWRLGGDAEGLRLATKSGNDTIKFWEIGGGPVPRTVRASGRRTSIRALAFAADGSRLATAGAHAATLWSWTTRKEAYSLRSDRHPFLDVALSPDGARMAAVLEQGGLRMWDVGADRQLHVGEAENDLLGLAFSSDGHRLATAGRDGLLTLWDADSGARVTALAGHAAVNAVAFRPGSMQLASGDADGTVRQRDTNGELHALGTHPAPVVAVAYSADGRRLISGAADGSVKVWDAEDGRELGTLPHAAAVLHVAAAPANNDLHLPHAFAVVCADSSVKVWDGEGMVVTELRGNEGEARRAAFSPDGGWLVVACSTGSLKLWELRNLRAPVLAR
jgi:WD40 repeat protein